MLRALLLSIALIAGTAQAQEKVTFLTSWFAQAEHGGFYQALATGLYRKQGLDVTLRMGGPQVNGMQLMMAGQAELHMGYDFQVLKSLEQGLTPTTVAASFQHDLQGLLSHEDVPDLGALKGKTILVATAGRTSWWPWLREKYGYTEEQVRPYTFNLQPFLADNNLRSRRKRPGSRRASTISRAMASRPTAPRSWRRRGWSRRNPTWWRASCAPRWKAGKAILPTRRRATR
jgi:NitT/TauT family transport system substrate-binding protein